MNTQKAKVGVLGAVLLTAFAVGAVAMVGRMAHADSALEVSCSGIASGNQITWTASSSGGNAPYTIVWSGDSVPTSTTSTPVTITYAANGTYTVTIQATDASSTSATATCSASVSSYPAAVTTSTLNVSLAVNNSAGGSAAPANFTVSVSGAGANPSSFAGNASGTPVTVNASTSYAVSASGQANYSLSTTGNCTGPIAAGANASCALTETYVPPVAPTSTPVLPRFNAPSLTIGAGGSFLAHGMIVTSVASGSFQGTVWGITYTVQWPGTLFPSFYFREGNGAGATDPSTQIKVGDEVGVTGRVTTATPMTVQASIVRDYSILTFRPAYSGWSGGEHGNTAATTTNFSARIEDLFSQLRNIQNMFRARNGQS